jgi:hypothetical protein
MYRAPKQELGTTLRLAREYAQGWPINTNGHESTFAEAAVNKWGVV